jgi:hypothetical protein
MINLFEPSAYHVVNREAKKYDLLNRQVVRGLADPTATGKN